MTRMSHALAPLEERVLLIDELKAQDSKVEDDLRQFVSGPITSFTSVESALYMLQTMAGHNIKPAFDHIVLSFCESESGARIPEQSIKKVREFFARFGEIPNLLVVTRCEPSNKMLQLMFGIGSILVLRNNQLTEQTFRTLPRPMRAIKPGPKFYTLHSCPTQKCIEGGEVIAVCVEYDDLYAALLPRSNRFYFDAFLRFPTEERPFRLPTLARVMEDDPFYNTALSSISARSASMNWIRIYERFEKMYAAGKCPFPPSQFLLRQKLGKEYAYAVRGTHEVVYGERALQMYKKIAS
jgi:hypothetical protein